MNWNGREKWSWESNFISGEKAGFKIKIKEPCQVENVPLLHQRSITPQDQALRTADLWLFAKGFHSAHGVQSKKLYSVQRKVSKQPKIKGAGASHPSGLKIVHGGGKIPLYLSNAGALPSSPTEAGIIHCVFLNFCVILNSIPLGFVVEEMPGLEQGSSRKTLGPHLVSTNIPLWKSTSVWWVDSSTFKTRMDSSTFSRLEWQECCAGNCHTDRCHTPSPVPTNWVNPHLPTQLIPWPHSWHCLLQGKIWVKHSLNTMVLLYEKVSCSTGTEIPINQNLLSASEISIICRERRQREGAGLGLAHSRGRDVRTEPGACPSSERGVSHRPETRLSEQGVCRSAPARGNSHGDALDQTFLKGSPDLLCFLESLTGRADSSRHCCLI